jgi:uncharacterized protein YndB with AHSA1/START domain
METMKKPMKSLEIKLERTIDATPNEVFSAWLDPEFPGTPWSEGDKLILNPKVDGLFYWLVSGTPHYGRFTAVERPARIQHTWMSPYTLGQESTVTLTFKKQGDGTLLTLVHSGLPDCEEGRKHEGGWNHFLNLFPEQFGKTARKKAQR